VRPYITLLIDVGRHLVHGNDISDLLAVMGAGIAVVGAGLVCVTVGLVYGPVSAKDELVEKAQILSRVNGEYVRTQVERQIDYLGQVWTCTAPAIGHRLLQ